MPDPPLSLSGNSPKQQRLSRARAIIRSQPNLTKRDIVRLIAQELSVDRATAYAYIREIKQARPKSVPAKTDGPFPDPVTNKGQTKTRTEGEKN